MKFVQILCILIEAGGKSQACRTASNEWHNFLKAVVKELEATIRDCCSGTGHSTNPMHSLWVKVM